MHTVFFSKAATGITLAGLKQPLRFCSVSDYLNFRILSMKVGIMPQSG